MLPAASGTELGAFLKANVAANSHLLTDGFAGYRDADLGEYLKHTPAVQDDSANAGEFFPIIHTLFSNIKAWLVGTHYGGKLEIPIAASYRLADAAQALAQATGGHAGGAIVLTL